MSSVVTQADGKPVASADTVLEAALALSPDERANIANRLLVSLDEKYGAELDSAQIAEIERRIANCDESKLIPFEQAMEMAKARKKP